MQFIFVLLYNRIKYERDGKFMEKIKQFQKEMIQENIDAFIVFSSDFHGSEYLCDYFKTRAFLSNFTGSAGTLLILQENAYLWTDGRYYLQAQKQLEGTSITLMKESDPKTLSLIEFLKSFLKPSSKLAFDTKIISCDYALRLISELPNEIEICDGSDLVDRIWINRPSLPFSVLYILQSFICGQSYDSKIGQIRQRMKEKHVDTYLISALEDQAWLYNLRGNDISHTPVFLAYTLITLEHTFLFVDPIKIDLTVEKYLNSNDITVKSYFEIYDYVKNIKGKTILYDATKVNYKLYTLLYTSNTLVHEIDMTLYMKAIKNDVEIKNTKIAHLKDGIAFTKFMYYLKKSYQEGIELSEISLSNFIDTLRSQAEGFIDLSFDTICAYKDHAAMMHYSATQESNYSILDTGLLLLDSGGHYLEGTTDITRTIALGEISSEMKLHFTTVLKSMIALSTAVFLEGCSGLNLDILARGPIWKLLIDYKCGTGHGVGNLLSVHEGPNGFRYKIVPERNDSAVLQPNMITTNEPGIYLEGKYGIRIENELLCVAKGENEFGTFLGFETLTIAPIDLDAIDISLLTQEEKNWLNQYHESVYKRLEPLITPDEALWLKYVTRQI